MIQKGQVHDYRITGVLKDLPKNSHMRIEALLRRDFEAYFAQEQQFLNCWGCQSGWVYLELRAVAAHPIEGSVAILQWTRVRRFGCQAIIHRYHHHTQSATQGDAGAQLTGL